ncbi:TPA: thiolase domain-containing protein [Candidatus Bathyarchaeota archaeon]|nr:thiolase domain-containing protein [Candidatus Bathyarchaeota archaeon]
MRKVSIIGVGMTKFGELWDKSLRELLVESGLEALKDASQKETLRGKDIQAAYVGNMSAGLFNEQEHLAAILADYTGMTDGNRPATKVEAACASGGVALHNAYLAVASGRYDIVAVCGLEKMTDVMASSVTNALAAAADREYEAFYGVTFPSLYAMMARKHMHDYGTTLEQLSLVAVKNHRNGYNNPKAQFRRLITLKDVYNSPMIADPLRLLHCSPISDGAATIILADAEMAKRYTDKPVYILACAQGSDTISLYNRRDITTMDSVVTAARVAYKNAGLNPSDIDFVEAHDCFTIAEIMAYEDLGFCAKGEGGKIIEDGLTEIDGDIPFNPSGGLKAKGHPVGATGVAQAVEAVLQLREEADQRQVKGAKIGMSHNVGGTGSTAVVTIYGREI